MQNWQKLDHIVIEPAKLASFSKFTPLNNAKNINKDMIKLITSPSLNIDEGSINDFTSCHRSIHINSGCYNVFYDCVPGAIIPAYNNRCLSSVIA